jgi:phage terminase large subunit-like protein
VTRDSIGGRVGDLIVVRPWQRQILRHLLARRLDGRYWHRTGLVGVARKNGKSAIGAGLAL